MQEVAFPRRKGRFDPSLLLVLLLLPGIPLAEGDCQFPHLWTGEWLYQHDEMTINTTHFGHQVCKEKLKEDQFVVFQPSYKCYRCVIINAPHDNFLQIREGNCLDSRTDNICTEFRTDDPFFSMFRKNAEPMACPFNGFLFTFSYNIGGNQCLMHPSSAGKCIDESKLILKYQSCPDVPKTESQVEELQCLAMWVESGKKYFVGTVEKDTEIDKLYRCFLYEEKKENHHVMYSIAQSGDETCSGLTDTNQGSANMNFTRVDREYEKCKYPPWVTAHHEWHSLDDKRIYHFTSKNATLKIKSHDPSIQEERILCHNSAPISNINKSGHKFKFVAHLTTGCDIAYVCMMFHQRDSHIIEVQQSSQKVYSAEEACSSVDFSKVPYTTLITYNKSNNIHQKKCQHPGRYATLENPRRERRSSKKLSRLVRRRTWSDDSLDDDCSSTRIQIGCSSSDQNEMIIANMCQNSNEMKYSCHGSWEDKGIWYTIVSEKTADHKSGPGRAMCFSMRIREDPDIVSDRNNGPEQREAELLFSKPTNVCLRHNSEDTTYRIAKEGVCEDATTQASSAGSCTASSNLLLLLLLFKIGTTTLYKLLLSS